MLTVSFLGVEGAGYLDVGLVGFSDDCRFLYMIKSSRVCLVGFFGFIEL